MLNFPHDSACCGRIGAPAGHVSECIALPIMLKMACTYSNVQLVQNLGNNPPNSLFDGQVNTVKKRFSQNRCFCF